MDARPVSEGPGRPRWLLKAPRDRRTQGLVVSGFGDAPTGRALFLECRWEEGQPRGGAWLRALEAIAPVTDATGQQPAPAALAFTWSGLAAMGLNAAALDSFSRPFREGMMQEDRLRRLGDRRDGRWLETVIDGGPRWSGNAPPDPADARAPITTPITVHAVLLLYASSELAAVARAAAVEDRLRAAGVAVVHRLPLLLDPDNKGVSREHFGFADGLSQPVPYDADALVMSDGTASVRDPHNGVPLGEILIGYRNGHQEDAPGPIVPDGAAAAAAGLVPHPLAEGFRDLGIDGSYMVVRELRQDVASFWAAMARDAAHVAMRDPSQSQRITAAWLAERVVGRNTDGHLLCPGGYLKPTADGLPDVDHLFRDRDPHGIGCPVGSHVRRANPRDGLAPDAASAQTLLDAANNHRILRRGRKYGAPPADPLVQDDVDRGLLFVCLNTDIARQFEFVQQTWLLNADFATLYQETDPLIGPAGKMTIQDVPLRRIVEVDTFIKTVGGEYFFLPSMPALRYLATL